MATFEREVCVDAGYVNVEISEYYVGEVDTEASIDLDGAEMYDASSESDVEEYIEGWLTDQTISLKSIVETLHKNVDEEAFFEAILLYRQEHCLPLPETIRIVEEPRTADAPQTVPAAPQMLPDHDFVKVAYTALQRKDEIPSMPEFIVEGLREYFSTPAQVSGT